MGTPCQDHSRRRLRVVVRLAGGDRYVAGSALTTRPLSLGARQDGPEDNLTARERAVLAQLVAGASNREIAAALFIGVETVKTHLRRIYGKLGVSNRQEAIRSALTQGRVP
jgi:ATP/maltotriose-dependent transcriptional regulator MalT